ncbi:MAG TPA: hypothetical protein VFT55_01590 [Planctomycetota bacterium]|nr:hypothetical protein [Planctomycetota bacterium]
MAATPAPWPASSAFSWVWLAVSGLVPPAVLTAARSSQSESERLLFEARLLYGTMFVVLGLAVVAGVWRWRAGQGIRAAASRSWPGAVAAVVLTAIVFALVPPRMRMQFDETSLVGVSQNMHLQRAALLTTGAVPFEGGIVPLENMVDKRPPLFAFLVSLLHDVSGCRIANAFAVNAGLLATALLLVFAAARARLGLTGALAAPCLLLAVPLTSVVATSAGFELLAAVLFLLVLVAALDFVRQPDTVRWVAFLGSGVLFAQSRYESLLALGLVGVIVVTCAVWRGWRPDWRARVALAICPGLLTPLVFLLLHSRNPDFYPEAGGRELLSLQHGLEHVVPFLAAWFWPLFDNALPGVLSVAAVLAYGLWLCRGRAGIADIVVAVPVSGVTLIVLCWFYGDVRESTALRLFLPLAWLTAQAPLLLGVLFGRRVAVTLLGAAVVLCGVQLRAVHRGAVPEHPVARLTEELDALIRELPHDSRTLWVGTPAQHLIVKGHAALSAQSFMARGHDLEDLVRRGHVKTVYVLETPIDAAHAPAFGDVRAILDAAAEAPVVARSAGEKPIVVHRLRLR